MIVDIAVRFIVVIAVRGAWSHPRRPADASLRRVQAYSVCSVHLRPCLSLLSTVTAVYQYLCHCRWHSLEPHLIFLLPHSLLCIWWAMISYSGSGQASLSMPVSVSKRRLCILKGDAEAVTGGRPEPHFLQMLFPGLVNSLSRALFPTPEHQRAQSRTHVVGLF